MQTSLKPAHAKARALLAKLLALAERGIDGERQAAQRKIKRLEARFDFSAPDPAETPDLFSGRFKPATKARPIFCFGSDEFEIANAVGHEQQQTFLRSDPGRTPVGPLRRGPLRFQATTCPP